MLHGIEQHFAFQLVKILKYNVIMLQLIECLNININLSIHFWVTITYNEERKICCVMLVDILKKQC